MKRKYGLIVLLTALIFTAGSNFASANEEKAVKKALDNFYSSLNEMFKGKAKPVGKVWAHSGDTVYMGADGGYHVGWKSMYKDWKKQADLKLGGKVKHKVVHVIVGKDMAVTYQTVESADKKNEGLNKDVKLRASSVFKKEHGKWKMVGHHVDPIHELEEEIN